MDILEIRKGGVLYEETYNYPHDVVKREVIDTIPQYLFETCTIAADVTLRDIFLLLQRDVAVYTALFTGYLPELLEEVFNSVPKERGTNPLSDIEYLELGWFLEASSYAGDAGEEYSISGMSFPNVSGIGFAFTEEFRGDNSFERHKVGDRISFGVDFTPVKDLCDLRVVLSDRLLITDYRKEGPDTAVYTERGATFTLGQILKGLLWEITWHGSEKDKEERHEDLLGRVADLDKDRLAGTLRSFSLESDGTFKEVERD